MIFQINKNINGFILFIIFIILLSNIKTFNILLNTYLGRSLLILFIITITYSNTFLGILSILFIIVIENTNNIEGFYGSSINMTNDNDLSYNQMTQSKSTFSNNNKYDNGLEGFDIIGTENNIQRGKQSNSFFISNKLCKSCDVSPFEGSYPEMFTKF